MKGNRQGSLSRLITRRSDHNRKIKYCFYLAILPQLVKKVRSDFFDKLKGRRKAALLSYGGGGQEMVMRPAGSPYFSAVTVPPSTSVMYCMTTSSMAMPRS